jgi:hypothetical protein
MTMQVRTSAAFAAGLATMLLAGCAATGGYGNTMTGSEGVNANIGGPNGFSFQSNTAASDSMQALGGASVGQGKTVKTQAPQTQAQ